jgi:hypothetical protein
MSQESRIELLAGLIGQFWHRDYGIVKVTPEEFASFDRPGFAKTLAGFALHPHGEGRTLLTYESRTACTDSAARRRFSAYWLLLAMRRHAEHGATSRPTTSFAPLQSTAPGSHADSRPEVDQESR